MTHPLTAYYRKPDRNNITMAHMLERAIANGAAPTYAALATKTGISEGSIHNIRSLLWLPKWAQDMVQDGTLKFKVARAFTDRVSRPDLREKMQPFIDGTLSTVYAERYTKIMTDNPTWSTEQLVQASKYGVESVVSEIDDARTATADEPVVSNCPRPSRTRPSDVLEAAGKLSLVLATVEWDNTIEALMAKAALKRLGITVEDRKKVLA